MGWDNNAWYNGGNGEEQRQKNGNDDVRMDKGEKPQKSRKNMARTTQEHQHQK